MNKTTKQKLARARNAYRLRVDRAHQRYMREWTLARSQLRKEEAYLKAAAK